MDERGIDRLLQVGSYVLLAAAVVVAVATFATDEPDRDSSTVYLLATFLALAAAALSLWRSRRRKEQPSA